MKPWRERIIEARERGSFTDNDKDAIGCFNTCMVGEQAQVLFGVDFNQAPWWFWKPMHDIGGSSKLGDPIDVVVNDRIDIAEDALDRIEDMALRLKREHAAEDAR